MFKSWNPNGSDDDFWTVSIAVKDTYLINGLPYCNEFFICELGFVCSVARAYVTSLSFWFGIFLTLVFVLSHLRISISLNFPYFIYDIRKLSPKFNCLTLAHRQNILSQRLFCPWASQSHDKTFPEFIVESRASSLNEFSIWRASSHHTHPIILEHHF